MRSRNNLPVFAHHAYLQTHNHTNIYICKYVCNTWVHCTPTKPPILHILIESSTSITCLIIYKFTMCHKGMNLRAYASTHITPSTSGNTHTHTHILAYTHPHKWRAFALQGLLLYGAFAFILNRCKCFMFALIAPSVHAMLQQQQWMWKATIAFYKKVQ